MIFCEELMSNGQTRSHFGPKVRLEEIAIHFLEARFWTASGWPTRVLGINGTENRVKLMQCCEFGA